MWTKIRSLGSLADYVLADAILIPPRAHQLKEGKGSAKKVRKQVTKCLQNLYQSVAIYLKYVLLVRLLRLPKYLVL